MNAERASLAARIGATVRIDLIWNGVKHEFAGRLESINDDGTVTVGNAVIPFISERAAIRRITSEAEELLFDNPEVKASHGWKERSLKEMLNDKSIHPRIRKEGLIFLSIGQNSLIFKAVLYIAEPIERGKQGGWVARVPIIKGCVSQGEDEEEAFRNVKEAALTCLEGMRERGERIPIEELT